MARKIPIDVSAVMREATDIDGALQTPVSVSVLIDPDAPAELAALVRSAFASASAQARVSIAYAGGELAVDPSDDMAVIVAATGSWVGAHAARVRAAGVPAMVVTTLPHLVREAAVAFGAPIPEGDVLSPEGGREIGLGRAVLESVLEVTGVKEPSAPVAPAPKMPEEPLLLDEAARELLLERMGRWVVATCHEKRLAFALSFGFVRRPLAYELIRANSLQNAGIGAVMFIPGADMPLMTLNQARMLLQIAAAYGKPMSAQRAKELAFVVAGAFACRAAARQLAGLVPGLGWAAKAGVAFAGTEAMGRAAVEYFEAGGDAAGFAKVMGKAGQAATSAAAGFASSPAGQKAVAFTRDAAWSAYDAFGNLRP